jgi:hypothetical protein
MFLFKIRILAAFDRMLALDEHIPWDLMHPVYKEYLLNLHAVMRTLFYQDQ